MGSARAVRVRLGNGACPIWEISVCIWKRTLELCKLEAGVGPGLFGVQDCEAS